MNKVTIILKGGEHQYKENLDLAMEREMWDEWSTNGANPWTLLTSFEKLHRPIKVTADQLDQFNKADENQHFIYGWIECLCQSDDAPRSLLNRPAKDITIEVICE